MEDLLEVENHALPFFQRKIPGRSLQSWDEASEKEGCGERGKAGQNRITSRRNPGATFLVGDLMRFRSDLPCRAIEKKEPR